jgi:hypothetical protein
MATQDDNGLSYCTGDPSGGSVDQPGRPRPTVTDVATPVLARPSVDQALRRPPVPRRAQSSGSHPRTAGSRERAKFDRRTRESFPRREAAPTHSNASSRRKKELDRSRERERRRVRRSRADAEQRARSVTSSEPDGERTRSPTPSGPAIPIDAVSNSPTPAGSVGIGWVAASADGEGILINTPTAPSWAELGQARPWDPNIRVSVADRALLWERSGIDMTNFDRINRKLLG